MPSSVPRSRQLGVIDACQHAGCGHTCCEFAEGNYIVFYPGEVQAAIDSGQSLDHLEIAPLAIGGHRAICRAASKANCDGGYKPLDCASYPFFPTVDEGGEIAANLKGGKCPLRTSSLARHRKWVAVTWSKLRDLSPVVAQWIASIRLVGYRRLDGKPNALAAGDCEERPG